MKNTIYGVVGYKGKLGSLLVRRPNFVPIDCDITNINSVKRSSKDDFDVVVNLAADSSIDSCEADYRRAFRVNTRGADNIMRVFGNRVLNISSDYVFPGWKILPPTEKSKPSPINVYGITKWTMEDLAINTYKAKVIRLSRTIHPSDPDLKQYFHSLHFGEKTDVPTFFHRNYLTRSQAVDGIEYFVRNFTNMPSIVNYGSIKPISFYDLMCTLVDKIGLQLGLLGKRNEYNSKMPPRPTKSGFSVGLAKKLKFPIYTLDDVVEDFWK